MAAAPPRPVLGTWERMPPSGPQCSGRGDGCPPRAPCASQGVSDAGFPFVVEISVFSGFGGGEVVNCLVGLSVTVSPSRAPAYLCRVLTVEGCTSFLASQHSDQPPVYPFSI